MNKPKIVITFTPEGMDSPQIIAGIEQEQAQMEKLLDRIQPALDVADAILKRRSAGPRG